jgi:hypothetical protein
VDCDHLRYDAVRCPRRVPWSPIGAGPLGTCPSPRMDRSRAKREGEALARQVSTRSPDPARREKPLMLYDEMFLNKPLSL